jgi:hypothetical protein
MLSSRLLTLAVPARGALAILTGAMVLRVACCTSFREGPVKYRLFWYTFTLRMIVVLWMIVTLRALGT